MGSDETGQWMEWHVDRGREFGSDYSESEAHPHSIPKSKTKPGKQVESAAYSFTIHQRKQMLDAIHQARIKGGRVGKGISDTYSYTIQQRKPKLDVRHHARRREGRGGKGKRESSRENRGIKSVSDYSESESHHQTLQHKKPRKYGRPPSSTTTPTDPSSATMPIAPAPATTLAAPAPAVTPAAPSLAATPAAHSPVRWPL